MNSQVDRMLKALEWFKDWSNYLLVTTVAAAGWVASNDNIFSSSWLKAACIWSFGISIIFGILTLALIPLIAQRINESHKSIYGVRADFSLFRRPCKAYLTQACRPQHISFMAGIVFYCLGTASENRVGVAVAILAILFWFFSKPKFGDES